MPKKYAKPYAVKHGRGCKYSRDIPARLATRRYAKNLDPLPREHHPPSSLAMYATGDPVYRRLSAIADEDVPPTACESRSASTA